VTDDRPEELDPPDTGDLLSVQVTLRPALKQLLRFGWILFAVWAATLITIAIIQPEPYAQGWRLVLELLFLGRAVSIADGIASGFGRVYLLFQNGLEDVILLLLVYPWVVAAYEGVSGRRFVRITVSRVRRVAEANRIFVEPWGVMGLWAFVFFPFWSTGALVGSVVGYILGMRTWVVLMSVFTGHFLSVISLVWFFDFTHSTLEALEHGWVRFLPWVVLAVLFFGTLAWRGSRKALGRGRTRKNVDSSAEDASR